MKQITPAKLVDIMVLALKKLLTHYQEPYYECLRQDIRDAIDAVEKVRKSLVS